MSRFMTRRQAIAAVSTATVAAPTIVPAGVFGQNAPSNRIVMGCVGVGGMGSGNMNSFLGQRDCQIVAVADVDTAHRNNAKGRIDQAYGNGDCKAYTDYRELMARTDIDAISQACPDHWHALVAMAAAKSGKDMYGEKPFTHTLREGRAVADAFKRYGRVWQTGSWQRSQGHMRRAAEVVRSGRIGKLKHIDVGLPAGGGDRGAHAQPQQPPEGLDWDMWVGPAVATEFRPGWVHFHWRWWLDFGGGQMMDWIGHHNDIAHWGADLEYTGPVEVSATGTISGDRSVYNAHDSYDIRCTYANGVTTRLASGHFIPGGTKWIGDRGWVHVDRGAFSASDPAIINTPPEPGDVRLFESPGHHRNFLDCVKSRRLTITPAEVAHRSASPGHVGLVALLTGRKLRFDPDTETILNDESANSMLGYAYRGEWSL